MIRRVVVTCVAVVCALLGTVAPAQARLADEPPSVVGTTYAAARETLLQWWPTVRIEVPASVPADADTQQFTVDGQVLRNPGWSVASTKTDPIVALVLSTQVPDLVGRTFTEASSLLAARALSASREPRTAGDDWLVLAQKPAAGTPIRVFSRRAVVALGLGPSVRVPDVVGSGDQDAESTVNTAGLAFVRQGPAGGTVVGQDPPPGTIVAPGSRVTVRVELVVGPVDPPRPPGRDVRLVAAVGVPLLLVLLVLALVLTLRGRRRTPRGQLRVEPSFPPPDIRVEPLGSHPQWTVTLEPRGDTGTHELEEIR